MTRGPLPGKAIGEALPVAHARGLVSIAKRVSGCICDFVIFCTALTAVVRVARTRRLHGSLAEIEAQFREHLALLRLVPPDPSRSLELWVGGDCGGLRFFRIGNPGLVEIDREGVPVPGREEEKKGKEKGVNKVNKDNIVNKGKNEGTQTKDKDKAKERPAGSSGGPPPAGGGAP